MCTISLFTEQHDLHRVMFRHVAHVAMLANPPPLTPVLQLCSGLLLISVWEADLVSWCNVQGGSRITGYHWPHPLTLAQACNSNSKLAVSPRATFTEEED